MSNKWVQFCVTGASLAALSGSAYAIFGVNGIVIENQTLPAGTNYAPAGGDGTNLSATTNFGTTNQTFDEIVDSGGNTAPIITTVPLTNIFVRRSNVGLGGGGNEFNREFIFYDRAGDTIGDATIDIASPRFGESSTDVTVAALTARSLNFGNESIFGNSGSAARQNNIERLDFVFAGGMIPNSAAALDFGFIIMERGGNDSIKVAPVLAVDGSGNPTQYGELVTITALDWDNTVGSGNTQLLLTGVSFGGDPVVSGNTDYAFNNTVNAQAISVVIPTLGDLGITIGQELYGYSIFAPDVSPGIDFNIDPVGYSNALLDVTNSTVYPQNTSPTGAGGLDLMGGTGPILATGGGNPLDLIPVPIHSSYIAGILAFGLVGLNARRLASKRDEHQ